MCDLAALEANAKQFVLKFGIFLSFIVRDMSLQTMQTTGTNMINNC